MTQSRIRNWFEFPGESERNAPIIRDLCLLKVLLTLRNKRDTYRRKFNKQLGFPMTHRTEPTSEMPPFEPTTPTEPSVPTIPVGASETIGKKLDAAVEAPSIPSVPTIPTLPSKRTKPTLPTLSASKYESPPNQPPASERGRQTKR